MRRQHALSLVVIGLSLAGGITGPPASASTRNAAFHTKGGVSCIYDGYTESISCTAAGLPRIQSPFGGGPIRAHVFLKRTGKPSLGIDTNGFSPVAKLRPGITWKRPGITCRIGHPLVSCTNLSRHGFTIGGGKYKTF